MKKCPVCGIEVALKKFKRKELGDNKQRHIRTYVCRNRNCDSFEKEVYQTVRTVEIPNDDESEEI